ncbi:VUT family protein [Prosthecomicrobium sp. N25]|uniref:VUT family protein n=1 Tax=Prosthecomicrobium sp. N25 TaxID=3129254 RepID=UPI003077A8E5
MQRRLGKFWSLVAIGLGAVTSAYVAPPALVLASTTAFLLSELADFVVYTPLQERRLVTAVVLSSTVGLAVDSIVFLWLAFGSLDFLAGQIVGKLWMVLLSLPVIFWVRQRDSLRSNEEARSA